MMLEFLGCGFVMFVVFILQPSMNRHSKIKINKLRAELATIEAIQDNWKTTPRRRSR